MEAGVNWEMANLISKIQLLVYNQCFVLIGWATTRIFVIASSEKRRPYLWCFGGKKGLKSSCN